MNQRVFLLGYMGSGKTTLGKKLANRLKVPFLDSDTMLEAKFGCSIADYFAQFGEKAFRKEEGQLLEEMGTYSPAVISLGGGLPCFGSNMNLLNEMGFTIYLKRSPGELAHRLMKNKTKRPLIAHLNDEELHGFIANHLAERESFYLRAQYIAPRNKQTVEGLEEIIRNNELV
jgi:shikimate kinase